MEAKAIIPCLIVALAAAGCATQGGAQVYIGTRGTAAAATAPAPAAGIWSARLDRKSGQLSTPSLAAELRGASWLVLHPALPVLYSVGKPAGAKDNASNLYAFSIDAGTGRLEPLAQVPSGGHDTTQLYLDARSSTIFGASYGGGEVTAAPLLADGRVGEVAAVEKDYGTGPHPRQASPHAHGVVLDPSGRFLLSSDLGADRIFVYRFDPKSRALAAADPAFETLAPGSGPRHMAFHPNGRFLYVNTELGAEVWTYAWDAGAGRLRFVAKRSAYPDGYAGNSRSTSEIAFSPDGRFLYVALRGDQNSIVTYAVDPRSGALEEKQRISSQGLQPWAFALDPRGRWMLVANNASGTVDVLAVDPRSGLLSAAHHSVSVPDACAVAFVLR
ncbi:MAG TPA: lactonase family protein [Steroidobacteraceae bacterium]|nr:lactonase family protein [Steroidobacteraceae bacterium]